jgi:hypothetical protein
MYRSSLHFCPRRILLPILKHHVSIARPQIKVQFKSLNVLLMLHIGKRISLQQWSDIQVSLHTAGSLQFQRFLERFSSLRKQWLDSRRYLAIFELFLIPQLQQNTEVADILSQQYSAPPHYHCRDTSFLDTTFPNKWVGWVIGWPPRSPNLTPLGFHFWGYVKNKVYVPPLSRS